jgi:asparagine synthase (glutamine-hydrolysing)
MCGIVGVCNLDGRPVDPGVVKRMNQTLAHRGPDGDGQYDEGPVSIAHRRLAVIDLSEAAAQPMSLGPGRPIITYNGEVYNFRELRTELEKAGRHFRSASDTEVVLSAYEEWGPSCVERFNGMFAFAVWDPRKRRLFAARDRYGVKPLYYVIQSGVFAFASEIKALLEHPSVNVQVCDEALAEYFTFQNNLGDQTLFQDVKLLPPGTTLTLDLSDNPVPRIEKYWDFRFDPDDSLDPVEAEEELYRLFRQGVSRQLVSDVPVGSYLSGGMDSGSITAVAATEIDRIHTFTGGFDLSSASGLELAFDERSASEMLSNLFKTEHYEVVMHAGDMEHVMPELTWHLEDPRVGQCYPNYYVSRLASRFVKVVLSGGGGDELFAGYPWRYFQSAGATTPDAYFRSYYSYWQRLVPDEDRSHFFNHATAARLNTYDPYKSFISVFEQGQQPVETFEQQVNASLYFEVKTFLHGLLAVEDKLSMAHSLETRVPFLDNDLVDFAMRVPVSMKLGVLGSMPDVDEDQPGKVMLYQNMKTSDGKLILRRAMERLIPPETAARAKQGFSAPDASWFRGESINYINQLLRDPAARIYEFLNPEYVGKRLDEHNSGQINRRLLIWSLLSFEHWLRVFKP